MIRVGVNGAAGRIGKFNTFELFQLPGIEVVALNDPVGASKLVDNYREVDSTHGKLDWEVNCKGDGEVEINGRHVKVYSEKDPGKIPWETQGARIIAECSGLLTKDGAAKAHLRDIEGPSRVIVSAPATGKGLVTLIMGLMKESLIRINTNISQMLRAQQKR